MLPKHGVEEPSEIQVQAVPSILEGKTVAMQSFTGSGKVGWSTLYASVLPI